MDGHAVLLADRCSPDTSHHKLRLPLLLPFLPFLLVATLWVGCLLTATIYALQLMEQLLEVLDPTPPDQFRNQPVRRSLFAETSTARLTRSGSFCCGWLWATSDSLAPEKPLSLLQRVRRFLRAPRRRLQLLLAESSTATLLEAPWLLLALWRGTPQRRGGRGRPPQLRRVTHDPKRAYYFVLARDELVWHATEAASSRGAMPAGSIRLDSIVEARPPLRLPPPPSASHRLLQPPPPPPPPLPRILPGAVVAGASGAAALAPRGGGGVGRERGRCASAPLLPAARAHLRIEIAISTGETTASWAEVEPDHGAQLALHRATPSSPPRGDARGGRRGPS